ncbi:MAG: isoprenylcysteine carboxylmethyltransferase family protein [Gammaproteobacteria bacterium]|nr:isoprenylcysteine carboxylmethyltransferase family protein [Gammaproteobacteria bacterium]
MMTRTQTALYGVLSYLAFLLSFLYLILFTAELWVPVTAGSGVSEDFWGDAKFNFMLITLFGLQHSIMARPSFKKWWTKLVSEELERSHYVLISTIFICIIVFFWRPMGLVLWHFENEFIVTCLWSVFVFGWVLTVFSTFLTNHFDLFGLRQVYLHYVETSYTNVAFSEHLAYRIVRHPMMLGMLIGFWVTPYMTLGHVVLAAGFSVYIVIGIYFEEKSLLKVLGEDYLEYQSTTPKLIPRVMRPKV